MGKRGRKGFFRLKIARKKETTESHHPLKLGSLAGTGAIEIVDCDFASRNKSVCIGSLAVEKKNGEKFETRIGEIGRGFNILLE